MELRKCLKPYIHYFMLILIFSSDQHSILSIIDDVTQASCNTISAKFIVGNNCYNNNFNETMQDKTRQSVYPFIFLPAYLFNLNFYSLEVVSR